MGPGRKICIVPCGTKTTQAVFKGSISSESHSLMKNQQVLSPVKVAIVTFQISPFIENEQQISSLNEMRKSPFLRRIQIPISANSKFKKK